MIHKFISFPIKSLISLAEKINEEADNELYDLDKIKHELLHLHMMYEINELNEEFYKEKEDELIQRYKKAKERLQE